MPLQAGANGESAAQQLPPESVIFGQTPVMRDVRQKLERVAGANISVLISGESGTGKDIIARLLHLYSPWAGGPFVKVNCPAIPGTLLESELFGYEEGAFTGAYGAKPGRVEMAHRGTLFLDEIAELDAMLQAKLLQLLQDGQFSRIGAQEEEGRSSGGMCHQPPATTGDRAWQVPAGLVLSHRGHDHSSASSAGEGH